MKNKYNKKWEKAMTRWSKEELIIMIKILIIERNNGKEKVTPVYNPYP